MTDQNQNNQNNQSNQQPRSFYEEVNVAGNQLVDRLNKLVSEGNIRRLIIKDSTGRTLIEVPLTLGVVAGTGAVFFAPFLAALGALAALIAQVHIIIERYEDPADAAKERMQNPSVVEINEKKDETPTPM
jgi:hypothetical protein